MSTSAEVGPAAGPAMALAALSDESLFRTHFENLPDPAYIFRRTDGDDFVLIAHNRAAARLPYSRTAEFVGKRVTELQLGRSHDLRTDLDVAATRGSVVRRQVEHRYLGTGTVRTLQVSVVPLSFEIVVLHTDDITDRVELEREVIASSERERTRIGHDLHDGLAQLLIGVKLLFETLTEKLAKADPRLHDEAVAAAGLVNRAIAETSELAQGLSPIRKGGQLRDALAQLAKESRQLFGIACEVVTRADLPSSLSESSATHLYRIAQEAITNAVKHGKATRVEIACEQVQQLLVLTIADNGSGMREPAASSGGMGIHIMRYRARSIGGQLSVTARPEGGTLVRCSCPRLTTAV